MSEHTLNRLISLLDSHGARYRLIEHPAAGKSEAVAAIRGTAIGQGAKALVCTLKGQNLPHPHILAVLPADRQADLARLAAHFGAKKASLASPDEVAALTDCVFGAIPPFSFHPQLHLAADPELGSRYGEIAFNAGTLTHSLILNTQDYIRIAAPQWLPLGK